MFAIAQLFTLYNFDKVMHTVPSITVCIMTSKLCLKQHQVIIHKHTMTGSEQVEETIAEWLVNIYVFKTTDSSECLLSVFLQVGIG